MFVVFSKQDSPRGYFSNSYKSYFTIKHVTFSSVTQYIMYTKACLFNNTYLAKKILKTDNPSKQIYLAKNIDNFDIGVWEKYREIILYEGLLAKFSQNVNLKTLLLSTDSDILVYANPNDKIYGVDLDETDPNIYNPDNWKGNNLLGSTLMRVRSDITF
jgi:ribA/ribD-fused uncharacterized protein